MFIANSCNLSITELSSILRPEIFEEGKNVYQKRNPKNLSNFKK